MTYTINEMFFSLQGEGAQSGMAAVFVRFTGCNLWSGKEKDRDSAACNFCDTMFMGTDGDGGGRFATAKELAMAARALWPHKSNVTPQLICTGGEPFLQLDAKLITAFHDAGFRIVAETNGTLPAPDGIDWLCVSPKAGTRLTITSGNELKLVYPQPRANNELPEFYQRLDFQHFFLQPMDNAEKEKNTMLAVDYCLKHPQWRLGLQSQKYLGIR